MHSKKGAVITPPTPIRRPGSEPEPPKSRLSPPEKVRQFFGGAVEVVP